MQEPNYGHEHTYMYNYTLIYGVRVHVLLDFFLQTIREHFISKVPLLPATVLELCQTAWQHHSMGWAYLPGDPTGACIGWSSKQVDIQLFVCTVDSRKRAHYGSPLCAHCSIMQHCYLEYWSTPLLEPNVRCTGHGAFFTRLQYV